ncbi:MAG TPA: 3-hydroxyacyl-CoA dehydrogenase family protein [Chitinophaga sp.]|uniref:3-hydroxyacyl-CoA dehydrogenase family protein n=1 Tax=Chitinophaga sp. TaxID=1869181 RepID=UPI002C302A5B|nr:3-hydroxyacyl-CoA dehydrogenase family protein [Chitinophaga sp.]HVI43699.1 3-hydroxyacyl-CoA dehydrogenase family protein [Chitinophaga sp.]
MERFVHHYHTTPVLVTGSDALAFSICSCLLQAGHNVTLFTKDTGKAAAVIHAATSIADDRLELTRTLSYLPDHRLAIAVSSEDVEEKQHLIRLLEYNITEDAVIAINTESIPLSTLQQGARQPARIIGANWSLPADTTFFLELIVNHHNSDGIASGMYDLAREYWKKDPYLICGDTGIRARLLAALAREACYLVENGYATVEDIDRACRNDAGYYLPFAGNFRYMDLMGVYAYGMVMKDLNGELSNQKRLPSFFRQILKDGGRGMSNGSGFYKYEAGEAEAWRQLFTDFSRRIHYLMEKYPFSIVSEAALK